MSCWGGILHAEWGKLPRVNAQLCSLLFQLFGRERTYSSSYDPRASSGFVPGSTLGSLMEYFCLSIATGCLPFLSAGITPPLGNLRLEQLRFLMVSRSRARAPAPALPLAISKLQCPCQGLGSGEIQKSRAVFVPGTDHLPCARQGSPALAHSSLSAERGGCK